VFITDSRDALAQAHERGRQLRTEAATSRLPMAKGTRRTLAVSLRGVADRLDPASLRPSAAR